MKTKSSALCALLLTLSCNPALSREQFDNTGLPHCKRLGDNRTPVPVWHGFLNRAAIFPPPSPPPPSAGGTIVYIWLVTDTDISEESHIDYESSSLYNQNTCGES